jgi:cytochrome c biogenesis protein CcmG/thiol:disulfide interchange protein DsbE
MSNRLFWLVIAGGLIVVVVGVALAGSLGSDPTVVGSALIDKPAPDIVVDQLDGDGEVRLSDYPGDVVVVNFWASWCTGCRLEHDALTSAAAEYADFDVTFLAVNTQDEQGQALSYLNRFGMSPETVYGLDEGSRAAFSYGVAGLPETFFIDRDGNVVGKVIGPVNYDLLARTIDRVLVGEEIESVKTGETDSGAEQPTD